MFRLLDGIRLSLQCCRHRLIHNCRLLDAVGVQKMVLYLCWLKGLSQNKSVLCIICIKDKEGLCHLDTIKAWLV